MSDRPVDVFRTLTNGIYVVTSTHGGEHDGFTAAWVTQVSFTPLLLAVSINPEHATWPLISASRHFVVNVLGKDQVDLARHFGTTSGRDADKLQRGTWDHTHAAGPVLREALAWIECHVEQDVRAGDHVVVIARALAGRVAHPGREPLSYADTGTMDGADAIFPPTF